MSVNSSVIVSDNSNAGGNGHFVFNTPVQNQSEGQTPDTEMSNLSMNPRSNNAVESFNRQIHRRPLWGIHEMNSDRLNYHFYYENIRERLNMRITEDHVTTLTRAMLENIFFPDVLDRLLRGTPTMASIIQRYGPTWDRANSDLTVVEREVLFIYWSCSRSEHD